MGRIGEIRQKIRELTVDMETANKAASRFSVGLYGVISILRVLGLPPKLDETLRSLQQLIMMANMARLALMQLQTAMGPVGWFLAGISVVGTGATLAEQASRELRSYG